MKTGTQVRLIQPEIRGQVMERRINPDTDDIELLVGWTDQAGEEHRRWFPEAQLQEVTP